MSEESCSWPEQDVIDKWMKEQGLEIPHNDLQELKIGVSKYRIELQDKLNTRKPDEWINPTSEEHFNIVVEALAEIKATVDGDSKQSVKDIVYGCLEEIKALPTPPKQSEGSER